MEKGNDVALVSELAQGRELARQLQINLMMNGSDPMTEDRAPELLVQRIVSSYEKALSMLGYHRPVIGDVSQTLVGLVGMSDPPLPGSPPSEDSDQDASSSCRKRKSISRWSQQVRVSPGMGLEGPLDDGFSWRKYGQKDILGAKYPRSYYRCTNRNVQGCLATKQVQRSDQDPTVFEITYRGRHTCAQTSPTHPPTHQSQPSDSISSTYVHVAASSSTPVGSNNNDVYLGGPDYFPPAYFGRNGSESSDQFFHNPVADVMDTRHHDMVIPTVTSGTDSPTVNLEFPFGGVQTSDPNFSFGNFGFFS